MEQAPPCGSACAAKRSSSAPAMASRGCASAAKRSHMGSWVPVPQSRRLEARPAALLRRRSSRCASSMAPSRRNIGWLSQRSTKASTSPEASSCSAIATSACRRVSRSRSPSIPAVPPTSTMRPTARSVPATTCRATRAPREYPSRSQGSSPIASATALGDQMRPSPGGRHAPHRRRRVRAGPVPAASANRPRGRRSAPTVAPSG